MKVFLANLERWYCRKFHSVGGDIWETREYPDGWGGTKQLPIKITCGVCGGDKL